MGNGTVGNVVVDHVNTITGKNTVSDAEIAGARGVMSLSKHPHSRGGKRHQRRGRRRREEGNEMFSHKHPHPLSTYNCYLELPSSHYGVLGMYESSLA